MREDDDCWPAAQFFNVFHLGILGFQDHPRPTFRTDFRDLWRLEGFGSAPDRCTFPAPPVVPFRSGPSFRRPWEASVHCGGPGAARLLAVFLPGGLSALPRAGHHGQAASASCSSEAAGLQ